MRHGLRPAISRPRGGGPLKGTGKDKGKNTAADAGRLTVAAASALAVLSVMLLLLSPLPPAAEKFGESGGPSTQEVLEDLASLEPGNRPVIELRGDSSPQRLDTSTLRGIDGAARPASFFAEARVGWEFCYDIRGLPVEAFDLELSMVEFEERAPGQRVFSVYANGVPLPEFTSIDLAADVGVRRVWQAVSIGVPAPGGKVEITLRGESGPALFTYARFLHEGRAFLAFDGRESRYWVSEAMPLRFANGEGQDVYEVVLGRMGSRFSVNPVPQLLGWRQSPLGTWTDDLVEQVLAFRGSGGEVRCLPFTDRYPVFSRMEQRLRPCGVDYSCSDPALPFGARISLQAPFYPEDQLVSSLPAFYLEIEVENPSAETVEGEFLFARPHRTIPQSGGFRPLRGSFPGYAFREEYGFSDSSDPGEGTRERWYSFEEAVAVEEGGDIAWHFQEPRDSSWIWPSPTGYPPSYPCGTFSWHPRGFSGFSWGFRLEPGGRASLRVALACHRGEGIMEVGEKDGYRFIYNHPAGLGLDSVDEAVDLALGPPRRYIQERSSFFDSILEEPHCSLLSPGGRRLAAVALQSYIINSWWVFGEEGDEWYGAWEGPPFYFLSTIDVEYNSAWFYLSFWPDLLSRQLRQWIRFEMRDEVGMHLPHDIGTDNRIIGMTYPIFGMEAEENADFLLLLYAYWKQTGDTGPLREMLPHAVSYAWYLMECDTDGDGLPDIKCDNSIDQAGLYFISSRNQTYLGVKGAAALRAAMEMYEHEHGAGGEFAAACAERLALVNRTLRERMWRGDHFAVSTDGRNQPRERDAHSIYSANGLLWLLASSSDCGLDADNLERMRADLASADLATRREFGCVHTDGGDVNQWVSQNLWRDALGFYLEVPGWPEGQEGRLDDYWRLERWWASNMNGSFYDSVYYLPPPPWEGPRRGAIFCTRYLDQTLGYYSRGAVTFGLIAAMGRLQVDRVSGSVSASPPLPPARVPVFACADWGAEDPGSRLPVLVFGPEGELQEVVNPHLLPERGP